MRHPFSFNRICSKLYLGSAPPPGPWVGENFSALVLCAKEVQPPQAAFPRLKTVLRLQIDDDGTPPRQREFDQATRASVFVSDTVLARRRVLVTCAMGINRSALVTALALVRLFGISGEEATAWVRAMRPGTLTNRWFADGLAAIPSRRPMMAGVARHGVAPRFDIAGA